MEMSKGPTQSFRTTLGQFTTSWSICFQPDGRRLAVCKGLGEVALLDADSLEILSTFAAHDNAIPIMAFSADSRLLATGSMDSTVRIPNIGTCYIHCRRRTALFIGWSGARTAVA